MIECGQRRHDLNRLTGSESPAPVAGGREPHRDFAAGKKLRNSSAALRSPSMARTTSMAASFAGLPPSCAMSFANLVLTSLKQRRGTLQDRHPFMSG